MRFSRFRLLSFLAVAAMVMGVNGVARADKKADLQAKFKERLPQISALKRDGKVGETFDGMLEAVKGVTLDKDQTKLGDDENADRKEIYKLIAAEEGTTAEKVAERNALRYYKSGKKGDWFKLKDGQWKQKEKD
jgi:uncharacterized protein YdbL (DUF1318 family)